MFKIKKHFDTGLLAVIIFTFVAALFTKDFIHDLFLVAAVFLVSFKLIMMSYKNMDAVDSAKKRLDEISSKLDKID